MVISQFWSKTYFGCYKSHIIGQTKFNHITRIIIEQQKTTLGYLQDKTNEETLRIKTGNIQPPIVPAFCPTCVCCGVD